MKNKAICTMIVNNFLDNPCIVQICLVDLKNCFFSYQKKKKSQKLGIPIRSQLTVDERKQK